MNSVLHRDERPIVSRAKERTEIVMAFNKTIAQSFSGRLASEKLQLEKKLETIPAGCPEHEAILRKLRQIATASTIDGWLSSPGLQPPT
jgi:hypothetical protein